MNTIKNIIKLINESKKTRYQIAKETGIDAGNLSRIVHGKLKGINLKTAFKLADALGVDVNDFREDVADE